MTVSRQCHRCGSPTRCLEAAGTGGGHLFLPFTPQFEATIDETFSYDADEPRWLCRFLDGHACSKCGVCDLAPQNFAAYMECDGRHLPESPEKCIACGSVCLGPITIECDGVPGPPLAFLAFQYGAPLVGRLCRVCGLTWMSLDSKDSEARRELAKRFSSDDGCARCGKGQLRVTQVDVPHSGFAGLYDPASPVARLGDAGLVADLLVSVCDSCGEAEARAKWR